MATTLTLGLARKNILDVFQVNEVKQEKQYEWILGNNFNTTQEYETFKQLKGLSPAEQTPEGREAALDDYSQLYTRNFKPVLFTKRIEFTELMDFTNQYKKVMSIQGDFAKAFVARRNIYAANIDVLGFTSTAYGMNSETLYSTSHSMGTITGSNRPATDVALSPVALAQALTEIRKQKTATNQPAMLTGQVILKVPAALEDLTIRIIKSLQIQGVNNNDTNEYLRKRVDYRVCDYYTSDTAWFLKMADNSQHGLFMLKQMPYKIDQLPMDKAMMHTWVARESYTVGWKDWHGTWGTTGA
jgi:hypothetical protein